MPRDAFPDYDEPVNLDLEPEDALRVLLGGDDEDTTDEDTES